MHFHGPAPHVEGSDVVRGVRFKNVSPVSWSCHPLGSQPRKDGVRLHNSYDISGSVLQAALYLWRGHLFPSQKGGALLLNKILTSNIVSLCQYSRVSRGRIWRWPGRRRLIHLPGIVGWLHWNKYISCTSPLSIHYLKSCSVVPNLFLPWDED